MFVIEYRMYVSEIDFKAHSSPFKTVLVCLYGLVITGLKSLLFDLVV